MLDKLYAGLVAFVPVPILKLYLRRQIDAGRPLPKWILDRTKSNAELSSFCTGYAQMIGRLKADAPELQLTSAGIEYKLPSSREPLSSDKRSEYRVSARWRHDPKLLGMAAVCAMVLMTVGVYYFNRSSERSSDVAGVSEQPFAPEEIEAARLLAYSVKDTAVTLGRATFEQAELVGSRVGQGMVELDKGVLREGERLVDGTRSFFEQFGAAWSAEAVEVEPLP